MDLSSIRNQREIKYIESPVIYKFHSEQQSINKITPSQQQISSIGKRLFVNEMMNKQKPTALQFITSNNHHVVQINQKNNLYSQEQKNESKDYEIHIISEVKDRGNEPIYSRFYKNDKGAKEKRVQAGIITRRVNNNQRRSSQEFPYYHKNFSPDSFKSSTLPPSSAYLYNNTQQQYTLPREQLTRYAANQVIHKTEKQLLQKQVSTLKLQLKTFEQKLQQLNKQKEEWIRCKNRNQILQREYKIMNEDFIRLKDAQMESIENKWRASKVEKIDLKDVSEEDFGKKVLRDKRPSYSIKAIIDENTQFKELQIKRLNEKVIELENQISKLKKENLQLIDQNKKQRGSLLVKSTVCNINTQTHKLEQQINLLKQQNIKLQQEKQSYISNYKVLKNEREKQCKQLKIKQEEIYQSLQKLSKDLIHVKKEKQQIQEENKKLKRKNSQLENQMEIMGKRYSRNSFEDKFRILQEQFQSVHEAHNKKIQLIQKQRDQQKDNLVKKYQQKISSLQNEISDLKDQIRQNIQQLRNYEKETKSYQKQINQYESKIETLQTKIKQLLQRIKQYQSKNKQTEGRMKEDEVLLKNKEQEFLKKDKELQKVIEKCEQRWRQLMEIKQKCKELSENILKHTNEKETLKQENQKIKIQLTRKQAQHLAASKQHSSQLNSLNLTITAYKQREAQLSLTHRTAINMKENDIKKQRVQIQGLLQQIVKLRQVKSQNYKLMEKQKKLIKIDSTVSHLWAVKQTQYENIAQILNAINCGHISANQ